MLYYYLLQVRKCMHFQQKHTFLYAFMNTRNFSRLRRLSFLFMGNMSPYYFKTIFRLCMKCMPSFIKIGGAVSEKNDHTRQTFVVLYIGYSCGQPCKIQVSTLLAKSEVNESLMAKTVILSFVFIFFGLTQELQMMRAFILIVTQVKTSVSLQFWDVQKVCKPL